MRRLFIAVNIPEDIKDLFAGWREKEEKKLKFVRFASRDNWHITLVFLGNQPEEKIPGIREAMLKVSKKMEPLPIEFEKIDYGPAGPPSSPFGRLRRAKRVNMIWAFGSPQTSKKLSGIKKLLEEELEKRGVKFEKDPRPFNAHITVGRFDSRRFSGNLPEAEKRIRSVFRANGIDLMESRLGREGAKYSLVFSANL